ncbi:MAG TPA: lactate utilization protein [Kiloniellaceae bacterium]|nr:lactate utilization protein [Kiloniellaceae bacterium]
MSDARARILAKVKASLRAESRGPEAVAALEARLSAPQRGLVPARAQLDAAGRLALFERMARAQSASFDHLQDLADVPAAVSRYLKAENLPAKLRLAPDPDLEALPWHDESLLTVESGRATGDDLVSLTGCFGAVAETGTLVLTSGPTGPTSLNFLPDTHIVVLQADQVVGPYEDLVARLRAAYGAHVMPRTVNFITGPSRTADIEQTIQLGAHGPRRLHILLVGAKAAPARD